MYKLNPKILILIIYIFSCLPLVSCDYKDIDRRLFIVSIGIDTDDSDPGKLSISFKAATPSSEGSSGGSSNTGATKRFDIYTLKCNSLADGFREIKSVTSLEPDYGHMKVVMFGKKYVDQFSINSSIDFFTRRRDFQSIAYITVGVPSAKEVLSLSPSDEFIAGNSLFMKFGQGSESPYRTVRKLYEMYDLLITPGCTPTCSIVEAKEHNQVVNRTALFYNGKLKLILEKDESKFLNILNNTIRSSSLEYNYDGNKVPMGFGISKSKTKIKVNKTYDSNLSFDIKTQIDASLEEVSEDYGNTDHIEEELELYIKDKLTQLCEKLKENKLDPLNLQRIYWAKDPSYRLSKDWLETKYSKVNFNISVKVDINSSGVLKLK